MSIIHTLGSLVAINSVSAHSNAPMIKELTARCERLGLAVTQFSYLDDNGVEKINMVATANIEPGESSSVELALVGHTDTVPFANDWTDALTLTERDGRLFGRGSCDTKGFIAAALTAVEEFGVTNLRKSFALIFTADEEVGCLGAKKLAEAPPFTVRNAIVGEPTSLQPMRAGKGYCVAEVTVSGREGHSAYPAVGASAIFRAARLVNRIESIAAQLQSERHEAFEPPYTTLNVGVINGGTAKNIIPGSCRFTLEWRPIPGQETTRVLDMVNEAITSLRTDEPDFTAEVKANRLDSPTETPADSPLVTMLAAATGKPSGTVAFGTESPQMRELGADAVVLGPGNIREAHRTGEFVPIDELHECTRILRSAIEHFCG
ncbi:MAG: acetylornithine deacetylase [Pyrinomonadaceae bacterium]